MSSLNPSVFGQAVTFEAEVTSNSGTPTGTVQILNGSTVVGTGTLVNGSVSIAVSTIPSGSDSIIASYLGGSGFAPSKSAPITQTVRLATTTTALSSSLNPAATNQSVTFTATVTGQFGGPVTGSVTFAVGKTVLGTAQLSGGKAKVTISTLAVGSTKVAATYYGNSNIAKSSASVRQTVH